MILATDARSEFSYIGRMQLKPYNQWVKDLTTRRPLVRGAPLSQSHLARLLAEELNQSFIRSTIYKITKGDRDVSAEEAEAIARITKEPLPSAEIGQWVSVPVISWVQAGNLQKPEVVSAIEDAPRVMAPDLDPRGEWIALKVEGDSMNRISPPESVIFVNLRDKKLVPNACYVISDEDGSSSYKRFRPGRFEPVSTNKKHKPFRLKNGNEPRVIGRVRKTVLGM